MTLNRSLAAALAATLAAGCAREEVPQTPPRQLSAASPFHYPEELWDARVEGETTLRLYISERGGVDTVRVEKTSGYAGFDSAAVRGVADLRFEPARRGDETVGAWVLLPVRFDLPDDTAAAAP